MLLLLGNIVQPIIVLKTIIGLFHVFNFLYKIEPLLIALSKGRLILHKVKI